MYTIEYDNKFRKRFECSCLVGVGGRSGLLRAVRRAVTGGGEGSAIFFAPFRFLDADFGFKGGVSCRVVLVEGLEDG